MHTPNNPSPDQDHPGQAPQSPETPEKFWGHIDQAAVIRLQQLDREVEASRRALRHQIEELCALVTRSAADIVEERSLGRLLLVLEHSVHLSRQCMSLVEERHQLLRW